MRATVVAHVVEIVNHEGFLAIEVSNPAPHASVLAPEIGIAAQVNAEEFLPAQRHSDVMIEEVVLNDGDSTDGYLLVATV